jgi:hypothetical protein
VLPCVNICIQCKRVGLTLFTERTREFPKMWRAGRDRMEIRWMLCSCDCQCLLPNMKLIHDTIYIESRGVAQPGSASAPTNNLRIY